MWIIGLFTLLILGFTFVVWREQKSGGSCYQQEGSQKATNPEISQMSFATVVSEDGPVQQSTSPQEAHRAAANSESYPCRLIAPANLPTDYLVIVGIGGVFVAVSSLNIISRQARSMRYQTTHLRNSVIQARKAAKATRDSVRAIEAQAAIMQDTAKRQLRAYMCVSAGMVVFKWPGFPEAQITIRNFGQSPAYDVRHWIHTWLEGYPLKVTLPTPPPEFQMSKGLIPPTGEEVIISGAKPPMASNLIRIFGTPQCTLYVYGEIRYRDIFGRDWYTRYRLIYGGSEPVRTTTVQGQSAGRLKPDREGNEGT